MIWSRNEQWMLTGDDKGYVKYWQANMNNVKMFQGHIESIRGLRYKLTTLNSKLLFGLVVSLFFHYLSLLFLFCYVFFSFFFHSINKNTDKKKERCVAITTHINTVYTHTFTYAFNKVAVI